MEEVMTPDIEILRSKNSLKDHIRYILFFILFVTPIVGMIFLEIEHLRIIFMFGIQITIFGMIILRKQINKANTINIKDTWMIIVPVLGLTITINSGINILSSKNNSMLPVELEIIGMVLFINLFLIIGLGTIFCTFYLNKIKKETCCIGVIARCIGLNKDDENQVAPTFKYIYKRVEYKVKSNYYDYESTNKFDIGADYEIYINPSNPEDIYIPDLTAYIYNLLGGLFFIFISCVFIYGIAIATLSYN
jgi:hypothetical protein